MYLGIVLGVLIVLAFTIVDNVPRLKKAFTPLVVWGMCLLALPLGLWGCVVLPAGFVTELCVTVLACGAVYSLFRVE